MSTDRIIILAAGEGTRLRPHTERLPKCMISLHGRPLLCWQLDALHAAGINDIIAVGGHMIEKLNCPDVQLLENSRYAETNMVHTLMSAESKFGSGFVSAYGDIIYNPDVIYALLSAEHDISVVIDRRWQSYWERRFADALSDAESLSVDSSGRIASIGQKVADMKDIQGQYIGLVAFRGKGIEHVRQLIEKEKIAQQSGRRHITPERALDKLFMTDLLQGLINDGIDVWPVWIDGGWLEIDTLKDLEIAHELSSVANGFLRVTR